MRSMPFMLFSAVALVAQVPANLDLVQRFNTELPGINQLLKELKPQEALVKVQGLMPAERPAFNATSFQTIGQSLDNAQGMMSLYRLHANVASEAGLWEKALEIQEKRAQGARATLADLEKAQAPIAAQWKKVAEESGEYIAKNTIRQNELQASIKALQDDLQKQSAILSADAVEKKQQEIVKKNRERQALAEDSQADIQRMQQAAQGKAQEYQVEFNTKIQPVLQAVGKEKGLDFILDRATIILVNPELDITRDVIVKADDAEKATRPATAAPKPAAPAAAAPTAPAAPKPSPTPNQ